MHLFLRTLILLPLVTSELIGDTGQENSDCKDEEILWKIKKYMENPELIKIIYKSYPDHGINPKAIWENLVRMENICNSEEALMLQSFCQNLWHNAYSALMHPREIRKGRSLKRFYALYGDLKLASWAGWLIGRDEVDFCQLIEMRENGNNGAFNVSKADSILQKFLIMPESSIPRKHDIDAVVTPQSCDCELLVEMETKKIDEETKMAQIIKKFEEDVKRLTEQVKTFAKLVNEFAEGEKQKEEDKKLHNRSEALLKVAKDFEKALAFRTQENLTENGSLSSLND